MEPWWNQQKMVEVAEWWWYRNTESVAWRDYVNISLPNIARRVSIPTHSVETIARQGDYLVSCAHPSIIRFTHFEDGCYHYIDPSFSPDRSVKKETCSYVNFHSERSLNYSHRIIDRTFCKYMWDGKDSFTPPGVNLGIFLRRLSKIIGRI